jgi:hypothetical protein
MLVVSLLSRDIGPAPDETARYCHQLPQVPRRYVKTQPNLGHEGQNLA